MSASRAAAVWLSIATFGCEVEELRYYSPIPTPPEGARTSCDFDPNGPACDVQEKCSIAREGSVIVAVCVPLVPKAETGEACGRSVLGYDDCEAGGLCTPLGSNSGEELLCRELCLASAVCSVDETCSRLALQVGAPWGACVPDCQFFGETCIGAAHCSGVSDVEGRLVGVCQTFGAVPEGGACNQSGQCGQGLVCRTPEGICRAYCDPEHPCPDDQSCGVIGVSGQPDVGVCASTDG